MMQYIRTCIRIFPYILFIHFHSLSPSSQDPATKYHGHLLLAHIIARFAIHKRIVLQVFHSLLKAHALEARAIVRQALDILTPVVPVRMEDANVSE